MRTFKLSKITKWREHSNYQRLLNPTIRLDYKLDKEKYEVCVIA